MVVMSPVAAAAGGAPAMPAAARANVVPTAVRVRASAPRTMSPVRHPRYARAWVNLGNPDNPGKGGLVAVVR
jgi:hypothetical protein